MAAPAVTFESLKAQLAKRQYAPIYLLHGEEGYYIDELVKLFEQILPPEERDFNMYTMYAPEVSPDTVMDACRRYPMMSEYQVVIVKEAQNLKNTDAFEQYLQKPLNSTVLVVCHKNGSVDKRKKLPGLVDKVGVLFESKKVKERDLPSFIENYLKSKGASIDPKSQQLIADSIGTDLSRLISELDKLLVAMPENDKRVTPQLVEDQIGVSKDFNGFELRDAVVNRNIFKANQILKFFDKNPKAGSLYSVLPMLFNYFQNLMIAYYCPQKNSQEAVAKWLELKSPWAAKDYMTGMKNYTGTKTMQIIYKIREIDAKSKGLDNPNTPPEELIKELIFFILH